MKLAIIGSRALTDIIIDDYVPTNTTEIVSGGARGIDTLARDFAKCKGFPYTEFLPKYERYGRAAPIKRNMEIALYADEALILWDGSSKGTASTIELFKKLNKRISLIVIG